MKSSKDCLKRQKRRKADTLTQTTQNYVASTFDDRLRR